MSAPESGIVPPRKQVESVALLPEVETAVEDFHTSNLRGDLRRRSVIGGAATVSGQGATFLIRMVSTIVLARLLTPADYGLVGMVAAVTGFVALFKDMGLSTATVQREKINHAQVSGLFWLNVAVSGVLTLIVTALASSIATFYDEPRLKLISIVFAVFFLFGGLTVQHQALLRRQMRFGSLVAIQIASVVAGAIIAILAAVLGAGYWSLVVMNGAEGLVGAIGVWLVSDWHPGVPRRNSGIRSMVGFGMNLTGFSVVNYFARNADNILIGKVWGASALGLYSKAYGFLMLPISQINAPLGAVAVPALSRLQGDPVSFRRWYCRAANLVAFATTPLTLALAVVAEEIILVVLGSRWVDAAPIFRVLAFAAFGQPIANMNGWLYTSLGQTHRMLRWGLMSAPVIVISFAIGVHWGAIGVAVGYAIAVHTIRYFGFWYAFKNSPVSVGDLARAVWRPTLLSVAMCVIMVFVRYLLARSGLAALPVLAGCVGAGLVSFFTATWLWPAARSEFKTIVALSRDLAIARSKGEATGEV